MDLAQQELKTRMAADALAALEKLWARQPAGEPMTLSEIEEVVRATATEVMAQWTARLVEANSDNQQVPGPKCEHCGQEMRYKGHKTKQLVTDTGEVTLRRAYYYCDICQTGFFPPR